MKTRRFTTKQNLANVPDPVPVPVPVVSKQSTSSESSSCFSSCSRSCSGRSCSVQLKAFTSVGACYSTSFSDNCESRNVKMKTRRFTTKQNPVPVPARVPVVSDQSTSSIQFQFQFQFQFRYTASRSGPAYFKLHRHSWVHAFRRTSSVKQQPVRVS
jgi:hypothetical protein